jgi:hypothetical protein
MITADEFEVWRAHPITQLVIEQAKFLEAEAERQWVSMLTATGAIDQQKLLVTYLDLRARKQAMRSFSDLKIEDIQANVN